MNIPFLTPALAKRETEIEQAVTARFETLLSQTLAEQAQSAREEQAKEVVRAEQRGQLAAIEEITRAASEQTAVTAPFDWSWNFRSHQSPRKKPQQLLSVDEMRRLAKVFDVLRIPIEHLKREARSVQWTFVPRDKSVNPDATFEERRAKATRDKKRVARAKRFFETSGGNGEFGKPRARFETQILEDLLVTGCFAVSRWYDETGRLSEQAVVDSGTIRVRVSDTGWTDPDYPYEQWLSGGQSGDPLTSDDLYYSGVNAVTTSPYYTSPIEWLLAPILLGLRADEWNRAFFEGDTPGGLMLSLDKDLRPDQVAMWHSLIREALRDPAERQGLIPVPSGTQVVNAAARRDADFAELNQWILRRAFAIYGVAPSAAGFAGEQYKVSQDGSNQQTSRFGLAPVIEQIKELYDDTLSRLGFGDLEAVEAGDDESVQDLADPVVKLVGANILTVNEGREMLGYEPVEDGDDLKPDEQADPNDPNDPNAEKADDPKNL